MILSFATVITVSYLTKYIFESRILPKNWDLFQCVVNFPDEMIVLKEATEGLRLTNGIPLCHVFVEQTVDCEGDTVVTS